jgi:hypothetical protein
MPCIPRPFGESSTFVGGPIQRITKIASKKKCVCIRSLTALVPLGGLLENG